MTSLHVICGLGPPQSKILATPMFRPLPLPKSWLSANRLRLQIFHSTISLPHKKDSVLEISDDVIACDLWFGPPPNQKSWLRLCL